MSLDTAKAVAVANDITATFDAAVMSAMPFYPEICTVIPSTRESEKYGWVGAMPGVREWLGDRQFNELRASDYTLTNKLWEDSLGIEKTKIEDDSHGIYGPLIEQLAAEASYHPDSLLFDAIINGESTACFDGQFMFDTDHSYGDSGTQSNDLTYDAADHTAVTVAEMKAAIQAAAEAMLNFKNDQGNFLIRPTVRRLQNLLLIVPTELRVTALEARESIVISNSTNVVIDEFDVITSPHLTSAVKMYLINRDSPLRPFVFQAREPLSRQVKGADDLETRLIKFMTQARYNVGYLAWWNAVLTTFN